MPVVVTISIRVAERVVLAITVETVVSIISVVEVRLVPKMDA